MPDSPPHPHSPRPRDILPGAALGVTVVLVLLALWPLFAGDFLPVLDAPQVQHQAAVIYDWNVVPAYPRDFDRVNYPVPNHLGIGLLTVFAALWGIGIAFKALLGVAIVGVAAASWALARAAGHSRWLLLAVLPWLWHADMFVGHVGAILGLPLLLSLLAVHLPYCRHPGPWRAIAAGLLLTALSVTHLLLWLVGAAMLPVLGAAMGWRRKMAAAKTIAQGRKQAVWGACLAFFRDLALVVPSLAVLTSWYRHDVATDGGLAALSVEWTLPVDKLKGFFAHMFDQFAPRGSSLESLADLLFNRPGDPITGLWLLGMALWVFAAVQQTRQRADQQPLAGTDKPVHVRTPDGTWYLGWAFALALIGYFALPTHVFRPIWVHGLAPRLAELVGILGALALPLAPLTPPATARLRTWAGSLALITAAIWMPIATLRTTVLIQPELSYMRQAFAAIAPGKSLLVMRPTAESRWSQAPLFSSLGQYYAALRTGTVAAPFIDPALQPVRWKAGRMPPQPPGDDQERMTWYDHARFYEYVAVFRDAFAPEQRYEAMLRTWPTVFRRGRWQVFRNPSPELWPPPPPAPKLDEPDQVAAGIMEDCGQILGLGWSMPYLQSREAIFRENRLRQALGWPLRGDVSPSALLAAPPPVDRGLQAPEAPTAIRLPADITSPAVQPAAIGALREAFHNRRPTPENPAATAPPLPLPEPWLPIPQPARRPPPPQPATP